MKSHGGKLALIAALGMGSILVRNASTEDVVIEPREPPKPPEPERKGPSSLTRIYNSVEEAMAATMTDSPRAALEKLKDSGQMSTRATYLPHQGAKQRAKEARRQAKQKGSI